VGLVQQNPESQFCTLRVEDEIVFGLENRKYPREKIDSLLTRSLEMTGIEHLRGRDLGTLSGGEKQKVALASILASQPEVILFDEPTSNLDPPSTEEIFEVILNLQRETGLTVLVIEHKLDFLSRVKPRIVEMGMGCILEPDRKTYPAPEIKVKKPAFSGSAEHPLLEVERLRVGYQNQSVLKEISFRLERGEWVSLMGDNGSGKSTLLLSLLGLVKKSAGDVWVLGENVDQVPSSTLGKNVGLVFQNPDHQLFASTVWNEAVFGARNFKIEESEFTGFTRSLLERAGL
jgi:energy-coupling factor transport system ATP-binding protein